MRNRTRRIAPRVHLASVAHGRGLVKVYGQVIEHPCLSRFLRADLSLHNTERARCHGIPIYGVFEPVVSRVSPPPTTQPILSSLFSVTDKQKPRGTTPVIPPSNEIYRDGYAPRGNFPSTVIAFFSATEPTRIRLVAISVHSPRTNETASRGARYARIDRNTLVDEERDVPFNLRRLISLADRRLDLKAVKRGVIRDRSRSGLVQYRTADFNRERRYLRL